MDIRDQINRRIADIRAAAITSQRELARRLGVDAGQLNRELAGRERLSDERREAIEGLLGLELGAVAR